jgi:hypothetical protein
MPDNEPQMPAAEQPPKDQSNTTWAASTPGPGDNTRIESGRMDYFIQMLMGGGAFLLLLVGIPSFITLIALHPPGYQAWLILPLIPTGLGVLVLVRRARRGRGLWAGFLIGLGLVALAFGICAVAVR